MKFLVVVFSVVALSMAQRPSYAGTGPKGRPGLASRFKDANDTSEVPVYNRIGVDGTTARIPVDARGDAELVDRLSQWERPQRPFWLLNADHIEAHRNPQANNNAAQNTNTLQSRANVGDETRPIRPVETEQRSSFLGALTRR